MADTPEKHGAGLNPALKQSEETVHDTSTSSIAPADSASVQREEGRGWSLAWLIITVVCVLIVLYIIFG